MNRTSLVKVLVGTAAAAVTLGVVFPGATMAASVNGRCTKAGAKSGTLTCVRNTAGQLRWARVTATTKKAAPTTAAATTAPTTAAATTSATGGATGATGAASVASAFTLKEWSIDGPKELKAGKLDFTVTNAPGNNQHELKIIKGTYAELPKAANGAVAEDQLPAGALVAKIDRFAGGETKSGSVELAPGKYLFVCNIGFGPNSHAKAGQVLDVTVS